MSYDHWVGAGGGGSIEDGNQYIFSERYGEAENGFERSSTCKATNYKQFFDLAAFIGCARERQSNDK